MLRSVKVEKIVVSAIPDLVETWTKGFGFKPVEESEKLCLSRINLMVFPGTVLLEKHLNDNGNNMHEQSGNRVFPLSTSVQCSLEKFDSIFRRCTGDASGLTAVEPSKVDSISSKIEPRDESKEQSNENHCANGACSKLENDSLACEKTVELERVGGSGVDGVVLSVGVEETTEIVICSDKTMIMSTPVQGEGKGGPEVSAEAKSLEPTNPSPEGLTDRSTAMQVGEEGCDNLPDRFSKMSCEELTPKVGNSEANVASDVESLGMNDEHSFPWAKSLLLERL